MPSLQADPLDDLELGYPTLSRVTNGYTGTRPFKVNARDPALVLSAPGLPTVNVSLFAPTLPGVICTSLVTELWGGVPDATGIGGWSKVTANYATPAMDGLSIPPREGLTYALWRPSVTTRTRTHDVRANDDPAFKVPIEGGKGVSVEVGQTEVQVIIYPGDLPGDLLARMLALSEFCDVNSDAVTLPAVFGTSFAASFGPGQLRYRTYAIETDGNLLKVTHFLQVARDMLHPWAKTDEKGDVIQGTQRSSQIYYTSPFSGLW